MLERMVTLFKTIWEKFRDLIRSYDLPSIMTVTTIISFIITLVIFLPKEFKHAKLIPLGFSEIEQIEIDAARNKKPVDVLTEHYAKKNDVLNKIFECWNTSLDYGLFGNNNESFARELEARSQKIYKYEFDLLDDLPKISDRALLYLKNWIALMPSLAAVNKRFSVIWKYHKEDNYHTEIVSSTDSKGNTTTTTRQVYDDTDHYYTYFKPEGELGYKEIDKMIKYFPILTWPGRLLNSSRTNAEGEYAADKSRRKISDRQDQQTLLQISRQWNSGSLYNSLRSEILEYNRLSALKDLWKKHKKTAKTISYNTNYTHDDGPEEYQSAENIRILSSSVLSAINQLVGSIKNTKSAMPYLKSLINAYIAVALDGKKGNVSELQDKIMEVAKSQYKENFPQGIDLDTFRYGLMLLWMLIGIMIGAGIGYLLKLVIGDNYSSSNRKHLFTSSNYRRW
jgi:hypothetical protein